jgi:hypothetical protein
VPQGTGGIAVRHILAVPSKAAFTRRLFLFGKVAVDGLQVNNAGISK